MTARVPGWRLYGTLFAVLLLGGLLLVGRADLAGGGGWQLQPLRIHPYPLTTLLPGLVLLLVLGGPVAWLVRPRGDLPLGRRPAAVAVVLLGLLLFGLQLVSDGQDSRSRLVNAVGATWSDVANGYFATARRVPSAAEFVREYDVIQRRDRLKLGTHPPGAVLVYRLAIDLYTALPPVQWVGQTVFDAWSDSDVSGIWLAVKAFPYVPEDLQPEHLPLTIWCLLFVAALGAAAVVPTYCLGAAAGDRRVGVLAAALLVVMPNSVFYYLSLDGLLMTLTALALYALVRATDAETTAWPGVWAGVCLGLALLVSLGAVASVALALGYLAVGVARRRCPPRRALLAVAAVALGLALCLLVASAAGLQTWTVLAQCLAAHRHGSGGIGHRQWLPWLPWNLIDYACLAGFPVLFVALDGLRHGELHGETLLTLGYATLAVLLLLDVSGTVRGETERLWLFFNPLLAASAAAAAVGRADRAWPLACQPLQLWLLTLALPPLVRPY